MAMLIALKLSYEKHCKPIDKFIYYNSVSLRPFITDNELPNKQTLGYVSNSMYKEFDFDAKVTRKTYDEFWQKSFEESQQFHDRLFNGEQWKIGSKRSVKWIKPGANEMLFHYIFTNLGLKQAALPGVSLIKIKEHYKFTNLFSVQSPKTSFSGLAFGATTTIENQMYWSLTFDTKNVHREFASYFIKQLQEILKDLLADI